MEIAVREGCPYDLYRARFCPASHGAATTINRTVAGSGASAKVMETLPEPVNGSIVAGCPASR